MTIKKTPSKTGRLFPDFEKVLRQSMKIRINNNLVKNPQIPKNTGISAAQQLLMRTPDFKRALRDLETKPRTEDLRK